MILLAYCAVWVVLAAFMAHAMAQDELNHDKQPQIEDWFTALLLGLVWPLTIPCLIIFVLAKRVYKRLWPQRRS